MQRDRRLANRRERELLYLLHDGCCALCGEPLPDEFHIDHIQQYARGGKTALWNLQPVCIPCHLSKSSGQAKAKSLQHLSVPE